MCYIYYKGILFSNKKKWTIDTAIWMNIKNMKLSEKKANIKKYIFLSSWVQSGERKNHTMIL